MWTVNATTIQFHGPAAIKPAEVLYFYDGPCIFTAFIGLTSYLFHKVDEIDDGDGLFLVVPTTSHIVGALKSGALSAWGALNQEQCWFMELTHSLVPKRTWHVPPAEIPAEYLPRAGVGLTVDAQSAADTIEQVDTFFSVKFTGATLRRGVMPLSTLKGLVDGVYDSVRKIFPAPVVDRKSLKNFYDFEVLQPKFASLVIAIERPLLDWQGLDKDVRDKIEADALSKSFDDYRDVFFSSVNEIISEARKGEIKRGFAVEHFLTLEQISGVVPTEAREIETVEFRASAAEKSKAIRIDDKLGERIRVAHRLAERSSRTITGTVIEINSVSSTFVIFAENIQRQVTCVLSAEEFRRSSVRLKERVSVFGKYTKRTRRDRVDVEGPARRL
jgi:hypothetical protein